MDSGRRRHSGPLWLSLERVWVGLGWGFWGASPLGMADKLLPVISKCSTPLVLVGVACDRQQCVGLGRIHLLLIIAPAPPLYNPICSCQDGIERVSLRCDEHTFSSCAFVPGRPPQIRTHSVKDISRVWNSSVSCSSATNQTTFWDLDRPPWCSLLPTDMASGRNCSVAGVSWPQCQWLCLCDQIDVSPCPLP